MSVGVCFWGFLRRRISNVGSQSGDQSILFFLPPQAEQSEERIPPCCSSLPPGSCRHAAVPVSGNANGSAPPSGWHSDFRSALAPPLPPLAIPALQIYHPPSFVIPSPPPLVHRPRHHAGRGMRRRTTSDLEFWSSIRASCVAQSRIGHDPIKDRHRCASFHYYKIPLTEAL